jgi:hypothetical protein
MNQQRGSRPVNSGPNFPDFQEVWDRLMQADLHFSQEGCPIRRDCFSKQSIRFMEKFENELLGNYREYVDDLDEVDLIDLFEEKLDTRDRALLKNYYNNNCYVEIELYIVGTALFLYERDASKIIDVLLLRGCYVHSVNAERNSIYKYNFMVSNSKKSTIFYFNNKHHMLSFFKKIEEIIYKFGFYKRWALFELVQVTSKGNYYTGRPIEHAKDPSWPKTLVKIVSYKKCTESHQAFQNIASELNVTERLCKLEHIHHIEHVWVCDTVLILEYTLKGPNILP